MTTPRLVIEGVLRNFSNEPKLDVQSADYYRVNKTTSNNSIGRMVSDLREYEGETLKSISEALTRELGRRVPAASLFSWVRGARPTNANEVEQALLKMSSNMNNVSASYEASEVRERLMKLSEKYTYAEMAKASGVSVNTISNWIKGFYRVRRGRIDAFEKSIHLNSKTSE